MIINFDVKYEKYGLITITISENTCGCKEGYCNKCDVKKSFPCIQSRLMTR